MAKTRAPQLVRLKDLTYLHIADDSPDVRGWPIVGKDGSRIGRVEDLLVDRTLKKAPYIIVKVDGDTLGRRQELLIPTNRVRLDRRHEQLKAEITAAEIARLPRYRSERRDRGGG